MTAGSAEGDSSPVPGSVSGDTSAGTSGGNRSSDTTEQLPAQSRTRRTVGRQMLARLGRIRRATWRLIAATARSCFRYRVTGLAAEAAFFAILSLPPLVFGLAGSIGYIADRYHVARITELKQRILDASSTALTESTVDQVIRPTLQEVFSGGRIDVISVGFVLALWSGSRALNVIIDTITIMYGLGGERGIVKARMLSFSLYVVGLLIGIVVVPLVLAGPELVRDLLPRDLGFLVSAYWPTVIVLTIAFLTTLYHLAVPVRTSWIYGIPGAAFTMLLWIYGSMVTRWVLQSSIGGTSIYGPLSAPIAVLLWLYVLAIALLIGAALNAAVDRLHPSQNTERARSELLKRLRERTGLRLRREDVSGAQQIDDGVDRDDVDRDLGEADLEEYDEDDDRWRSGADARVRSLFSRRLRRWRS